MQREPKDHILYVDDEPNNLSTLKRAFKREYNVHTALSGQLGLEALAEFPEIKIVISDQRMPKMIGTEFLKIVAQKYPQCIRIILTGFSDMQVIVDSINEGGGVFRYLTKPWKRNDLKHAIDTGLENYKLKSEKKRLLSELQLLNESLEDKVKDQTFQLKEQNEELSLLNESLEKVNILLHDKNFFLEKVMELAPNSLYLWDCSESKLLLTTKPQDDYLSYISDILSPASSVNKELPIHENDWAIIKQHVKQFEFLKADEQLELTYRIKTSNGTLKWLNTKEMVFKTDDMGKPLQILGTAQDITKINTAKIRLEEFKNGLRALKLISSDTSLDFSTQITNAISFMTKYWKMEIGIIAYVDDNKYKVINSYTRNNRYALNKGETFQANNETYTHNDALALSQVSYSEYYHHPCFHHIPVTAYIGCSFWVNGKKAGVINILSTNQEERSFGVYDLDFIRVFAKWLGFTLEREQSHEKLWALNESKNRILATVVHDLRSPIQSIQGAMTVMKLQLDDALNQQDKELFGMINQSCDKTINLINELLEISVLEDENYKLPLEAIHINEFIEDATQLLKTRAAEKGLSFELKLAETEKVVLDINKQKFVRVIENLVSNALKFTPSGGKIKIETFTTEANLLLWISDTGIGIPEALLSSIFNKFSKARRLGLQGEKSTGLGMSIVKQIIELHQGQIEVESIENEGTTFKIILPKR